MNASLYHLASARTADQVAEMTRLEAAGVCLFCPGQLEAAGQKVVHRTDAGYWSVAPNRFPYAGARVHLLLVPDVHVEDLVDLPLAVWADLREALSWTRGAYRLDHYGLGVRAGTAEHTGATIRHLHVHVLAGDVNDPAHRGVRMKFSSRNMI